MALLPYMDAINPALGEEMRRDASVFIIGEDVGVMGGAFKATKGLYDEFGPDRVIDCTPRDRLAVRLGEFVARPLQHVP